MLLALAAMLFVGVATAAPASAAPPQPSVAVPVTGTAPGNTFAGTLDINRFATQAGQLVAQGTLTGTLTNTATGATTAVGPQAVTLPVDLAQTTGTCEILNLVLGPLDLDLLGLVVHLDQVVLNITAEQGPGNLLGNLLCAVAGLLDGPTGGLNGLAALLNRILAILG